MTLSTTILTAAALVCWIAAMLLIPQMKSPRRHGGRDGARWAMVALGVPLLGLVTWCWGPIAGFLAFGGGILLLMRPRRAVAPRVGRG